MMQETSKSTPTKKILVLISVIAFALVGWLVGHILRFSISTFRHPPIQKDIPHLSGHHPVHLTLGRRGSGS